MKATPKCILAAEMIKNGASVDDVMERFGWSRRTTWQMTWRGKNYEKFKAMQRARQGRLALTPDEIKRREGLRQEREMIIASSKNHGLRETARMLGVSAGFVAGIVHRDRKRKASDGQKVKETA